MFSKQEIISCIIASLSKNIEVLKVQFQNLEKEIGYFFVDELLPNSMVQEIYKSFPTPEQTRLKKSLKENKYVSAQVNEHPPIIEAIIFAFQNAEVIKLVEQICGIANLEPDPNLYAGGVSMMGMDSFLNPHLDNSHDKDRLRFRALNLLYYVTPNWAVENGGNLELWPNGVKEKQITIHAKCNRLVVMATHKKSWHSVSKVTVEGFRCCVSNYYFSSTPIDNQSEFHVTTFRGRPEQKFRDKLLKLDAFLRMQIRKVFKKGIVENPHVYKKEE